MAETKEQRHQYYLATREHQCARSKQYRQEHPEQTRLYNLKHNHFLKVEVLLHYGNGGIICNNCGNTNIDVLCIDHIHGGGTEHIKSLKTSFYWWLKKQGFPSGYQVLCANCNMEKGVLTGRGKNAR